LPNIKSAKKRVLITERNRLRNRAVKSTFKTAIRKLTDTLATTKDEAEIKPLLDKCYCLIDKAVGKGVIHPNTAARKKSRLTKHVQKIMSAE
jgi:small subunit ribosomal protein S20